MFWHHDTIHKIRVSFGTVLSLCFVVDQCIINGLIRAVRCHIMNIARECHRHYTAIGAQIMSLIGCSAVGRFSDGHFSSSVSAVCKKRSVSRLFIYLLYTHIISYAHPGRQRQIAQNPPSLFVQFHERHAAPQSYHPDFLIYCKIYFVFLLIFCDKWCILYDDVLYSLQCTFRRARMR